MKKKAPAKTICIMIFPDRKNAIEFSPTKLRSVPGPFEVYIEMASVTGETIQYGGARELRKRLRQLTRGEK